jgi:hypothetical protein
MSGTADSRGSGDKAIALLRESFGKGYIEGGTGKQIIIK